MVTAALQELSSLSPAATAREVPYADSRNHLHLKHEPGMSQPVDEGPKRVLFVTSELSDFVKVGGLGDVSAALPRSLAARHDVRLLMPAYREVFESGHQIERVGELPGLAGIPPCEIGRIMCRDGLQVYVVICPELFEREGNPYCDELGEGWPDNDIRFGRLCLAAADIAGGEAELGWVPDLLHLNDWPTGLTAAYMHWRGRVLPTVFTIHNLAYQGDFSRSRAEALGVPASALSTSGVSNDSGGSDADGIESAGRLSFLKAGLAYATHISTVSATYAREITTPEYGCGLDGLLAARAAEGRLTGIPNGIDDTWDSRTDPYLACNFGMNDWRGKRANTQYVRRMYGLAVSNGPLFAVVSRLVHQKGLDLTVAAAETIVRAGGQIVIIGRGERPVENALCNLAARFPGAIGVNIGFEEGEARCMYAGSDFLLMPSRFEPCGLSQMYAQRFASLPVAHRTGGLADTIEDGVTGFLFEDMSVESYMGAIERAMAVFGSTDLFYAMRRAAMASRYQWREAVKPYHALYLKLLDEFGQQVPESSRWRHGRLQARAQFATS